ncbi:MAG: PHB depolymerase family esterase [Burkholderiaceae bacterium]|nr:PHB depolymerase family esterase [Burkholderiaceae bacterium]
MSLHNLTNSIDQALTAAGIDTRTGAGNAVVDTIRKALEAAHIAQHSRNASADASANAGDADVIDVQAQVVDATTDDEPVEVNPPSVSSGQFLRFEHSHPLGRRAYKLYVPATYDGSAPLPLVVMLHGCKQDPDDFALGTRMNQVAAEQGFLVAYPEQTRRANGSNCWNWFEPQHQDRAGAEPSIIAGIVREIGRAYRVDERSVFVAGLSAGAAMAVILGATHPDLFAAVAAHSGLPHGAAHDVASAFAAMHGAQPAASPLQPRARRTPESSRAVPTIVLHGTADATVVPSNGDAIVQKAAAKLASERGPLTRRVEPRVTNGRLCTRIAYLDPDGLPVVEQWVVQGGGHGWFGGSNAGSFAEPNGPDASREVLRFFMSHVNREARLETSVT